MLWPPRALPPLVPRSRPADPFAYLAGRLNAAADAEESKFVDPYSDPIYEIQIQKIQAKIEREAARAAAAVAKAEREMLARAATAGVGTLPEVAAEGPLRVDTHLD